MSERIILEGDSLEVLKDLPDNSIDAIVTDPPYGLSFMGKKWDYEVPKVELWKEVLRVLKPGGHILAACGTRTQHRMAINIEDAGFEIRDVITWHYGSGFPKSMDISKAIDKAAGAEREVVGAYKFPDGAKRDYETSSEKFAGGNKAEAVITAPSTPDAKKWAGFGTALKPATEFWTLARKPIEGTVAANVLKHGVGGLNIEATRITTSDDLNGGAYRGERTADNKMFKGIDGTGETYKAPQGRFPANVIFDEFTASLLDEQSGTTKGELDECDHNECDSTCTAARKRAKTKEGVSRFFYVAKASKAERNKGLEGELKKKQGARPNSKDSSGKFPDHDHRESGGNNHPTVKPVKLMEYLVNLITPPGGTVLDPFVGSGTTGVACKNLDVDFIGIELSPEYAEIARKRVE